MEVRRTLTMNWDGLGDFDDDDDLFFDAQRLSDSSSSDEEEEFDDTRMSFSSSVASDYSDFTQFQPYDMWMAAPESITDRRRRLLHDMGLGSSKDLSGSSQILSKKTDIPSPANDGDPVEKVKESLPVPVSAEPNHDEKLKLESETEERQERQKECQDEREETEERRLLSRSTSDGGIDRSSSVTKQRKEEMIGTGSKQRLFRTFSGFSTQFVGLSSSTKGQQRRRFISKDNSINSDENDDRESSILVIKNLDNGKEFMVKECNKEENWNRLSDVKTGKQITMEEFEKNAGHSPKVKELMKKGDANEKNVSGDRKLTPGNSFHKSFKKSKKKGAALFKNIKLGSIGATKTDKVTKTDKEIKTDKETPSIAGPGSNSVRSDNQQSVMEPKSNSQWVKARVHGKPYKELTAIHRSQEIQGHEGSIWAMKFTYDGHFLASAGEDRVIHVWEVQEFDVMAMRGGEELGSGGGTGVHAMAMVAGGGDGRPPLPEAAPERRKKGKKKKGIPDYVHVPETVFGLSESPVCRLEGHEEDVLDLSWSRSRLLLSSSMDKTVRLWDTETTNCLKIFAHTDYVTCVQFNPEDDDYFISGSLDSKVRIWNIPDRHVVDWIDLHEMVTAVGYSNDGKVAVVGSNKGVCRFYNTADCKLEFKEQVELKTKKKPQPKKITGFQFSTWNPSEVLVTSADSRVRILDGAKIIQKFKGYKNNNSQLLADYSPDGKYIISASEDSQVYIWRHEETKAKNKHIIITSYEHFPCKEVSVTAPWPGSSKLEQPLVAMHSKKHSKRSTTTLPPPAADDTSQGKPSSTPLPPLPKRSNPQGPGDSTDQVHQDIDQSAHADSSVGPCESFSSAVSSSGRFDDMTSPSPISKSSPGWGGGNHGHKTIQARAWGLVIVTAGLSGEIKVFQNVGLPFKVGRL